MDDLHTGVYMADLLVSALRRDPTRPAVYLDDEVLTTGQLSEQVSRYLDITKRSTYFRYVAYRGGTP